MKQFNFILFILLVLLLIPSWGSAAGPVIKNPDRPQMGKWDCKLEKVWQMDAIGDIVLGNIMYMKVNENGNLYLAEPNQNQIYVLDPDGKLIVSFGSRGEGPGEFRSLYDFFITGAYVIVPGMAKIHYFSQKGDFIKDVNPGKQMIPRLFIDENRLVKFTFLGSQISDEPNYIEIYHLETKKTKKLIRMNQSMGVLKYSSDSITIVLRPQDTKPEMVLGTDSQALFYGNNDQYQINKVDFNGQPLLSFSIEGRKKNPVSREAKKNHFRSRVRVFDNFPEKAVKGLLDQMPDQSPYFHGILFDKKGRIYVLLIDLEHKNQQAVDIFSKEGKYLYHTVMDISGDFVWMISFAISFVREELFVFAEDEEGEQQLVKYKIHLPR